MSTIVDLAERFVDELKSLPPDERLARKAAPPTDGELTFVGPSCAKLGYALPFRIRWSPELRRAFEELLARYGLTADYGVYAHGLRGRVDVVAVHDLGPVHAIYLNRHFDRRRELLADLVALLRRHRAEAG